MEIKGKAMQIQQSIQNTWRQEGLFHILPSFALYHSQDMMTDDYGFIFSWIIWSWGVEIWMDA
jgi:hypothetical protein